MATHKFLTVKDGGYFYRHYPNIPRYRETPKDDPLQRELFFSPPPAPPLIQINTHSLYGKFLDKYNAKGGLTIELEQKGEITLHDHYSNITEDRELVSILIINNLPDAIYNYPFEHGKIYQLTTTKVYEL